MKMVGRSWGAAAACFLVGLVWFVGMARGDSMAIQADGKIIVTGRTNPEFGALARLQPDGSLDTDFGRGGYAYDKRVLGLTSVGVQPDGRIVAGVFGAFRPVRYLADGTPDPAFAGGAVGGSEEPPLAQFFSSYQDRDPVVLRPDGSIVVGKNLTQLGAGDGEAWVRRYDSSGTLLETVGHVPPLTGPGDTSLLKDLLEDGEGRLYGVGSTYDISATNLQAFLARFLPGSGTDFDTGFAEGSGLARPVLPVSERSTSVFSAIAKQGEKLLAAGRTHETLLLSRFDADGSLDTSFGDGGSATPSVPPASTGPAGQPAPVTSWANDVVSTSGAGIVTAGGTTQGATWTATRSLGVHCEECPQPQLARFDADGKLDPSFGSDGLLRLHRPDSSALVGEIEQVEVLGADKLLLRGSSPNPAGTVRPFVARLNADGSYDPSFGTGGLAFVDFPCNAESVPDKQQLGCVPRLRPGLRVTGLRRGRPSILLRAKPTESWAGIHELSLRLPPGIRLKRGFRSKLRVTPVGSSEAEKMEISVIKPSKRRRTTTLLIQKLGIAREVKVRLPRTSLRVVRRLPKHRKVKVRMRADFTHLRWGRDAGYDEVVRRVG
jgi:uncharacterized delta-60 repeat protein